VGGGRALHSFSSIFELHTNSFVNHAFPALSRSKDAIQRALSFFCIQNFNLKRVSLLSLSLYEPVFFVFTAHPQRLLGKRFRLQLHQKTIFFFT
jgi:hypothetical protein